jgi:VanZ family protein
MPWFPTVLWLALIASFSTDTFSAEHTGGVLKIVVRFLFGGLSPQVFDLVHFLVRKGAHFTVYGTLSWLAFRSWRAVLPAPAPWLLRWSALAMSLALLAASLDEFHQSFIPSRTSSPYDVMLDMTGALCFQIVIFLLAKMRKQPAFRY